MRVRHHLGVARSGASAWRISSSVSSRPVSPKVVAAGCAAISSASARLAGVARRRASTRSATASSKRRTSARGTPSATSRTVSPWLMGMPPAICARYSPKAQLSSSCSISPKRPARPPGGAPSPASAAAPRRRSRATPARAPPPARHRGRRRASTFPRARIWRDAAGARRPRPPARSGRSARLRPFGNRPRAGLDHACRPS